MKVESAGNNVGNIFKVYINGKEVNLSPSRGWNIAVFDKDTFNLKTFKTFDTYYHWRCSTTPSNNLASFIPTISYGDIVAYGVFDEATNCMYDNAYTALRNNL